MIREHRSTMIFVNSRRLAERLASAVNELADEELALANVEGGVAQCRHLHLAHGIGLEDITNINQGIAGIGHKSLVLSRGEL